MASHDINISRDMVVRVYDPDPSPTLEIRVGEPNWHREAAVLTVEQATALREAIDDFLKKHR